MKLALAYKNFAANRNVSHIGLGVAAMNTQKTLRREGIDAVVWPIVNSADLRKRLHADAAVSHVVISAPWIPSAEIQALVNDFPHIELAMTCHSNVGFLQADTTGVKLVRQAMEIERSTSNFRLAGNSSKFCQWVQRAYAVPCTYLPNLYYLDQTTNPHRPPWTGGTLRIGAFGATRALKNFLSAAGAAVEMAQTLRTNTEIWFSAGRTEGGGDTILRAAREMLQGLPFVKLVENGWETWPHFRGTVSHMHLLMQPSYTESFNMVTADGIASGVASVVSDAIDWVPEHWRAQMDNVSDMARVGRCLLLDQQAPLDGLEALKKHNVCGVRAWKMFLGI